MALVIIVAARCTCTTVPQPYGVHKTSQGGGGKGGASRQDISSRKIMKNYLQLYFILYFLLCRNREAPRVISVFALLRKRCPAGCKKATCRSVGETNEGKSRSRNCLSPPPFCIAACVGSIPKELGDFTDLNELRLSCNQL